MAVKKELQGLTEKQARERLAKYGENMLSGKKEKGPLGLFLGQFKDILIIILAGATIISIIAGQSTEAISIIAIMLLNAFMGFIQEYRTEKTIKSLKAMSAPMARVYRSGQLERMDAALLVPGDVVELKAGDRIPADCLLLEGVGLKADESILTGESEAVSKQAGDRKINCLYMGTSVVSGHGRAQVTQTGMRTSMGGIASLISGVKEEPTLLQKKLASLGTFIAITCLLCGAAVVTIGLLRSGDLLSLLLTGISLAVAAIPEGLPAIVTIVLALSVNRILSRGAVIRKLHAVETLGSASVICTDKTGTITENRMTVTELFFEGRRMKLSGGGRAAVGMLTDGGRTIRPETSSTLKAANISVVLCANATVEREGDKLVGDGSPTEVALLCAAYKCGVTREKLVKEFRVLDENPFDSGRKMMSVFVQRGNKKVVMVKGAPDVILACCTNIGMPEGVRPISPQDRAVICAETNRMAADAQRVIAVAVKNGDFTEEGLTFLALYGMKDPPRREVKEAVRVCREAGIKPVMITGDHAATARAIAAEVGILQQGDRVIEGAEIERMSEDELRQAVDNVSVFARVSPKHKLRIVKAFKRQGHVAAMTGDGVNDAPAIKEADIGVAMGISGSDVTKEASSVVIMDDNFATIVAAVEEGRIIYQNIRRFIRFLLTTNLSEVLTVVLAMALGMPAIFLPIQLLLINFITDGLPAVAIGMEPAEKDIMKKPPRPSGESLFAGGLTGTILFRGMVLGLCNVLCFSLVFRLSGDVVIARSATYMTLVIAQMMHVLEIKLEKGFRNVNLLGNKTLLFAITASVAVTLAVVYLPTLQSIFETTAVLGRNLLPVLGCILISPVMGLLLRIGRKKKT